MYVLWRRHGIIMMLNNHYLFRVSNGYCFSSFLCSVNCCDSVATIF